MENTAYETHKALVYTGHTSSLKQLDKTDRVKTFY